MTFIYDPKHILAHDADLGLKVERDTRYKGEALPALQFRDTIGTGLWFCPVAYERSERTYVGANGPRRYLAEVGCRIARDDLGSVVRDIAAAKAAQGIHLTFDQLEPRLLEGATLYLTQGGAVLDAIPDFQVTITK